MEHEGWESSINNFVNALRRFFGSTKASPIIAQEFMDLLPQYAAFYGLMAWILGHGGLWRQLSSTVSSSTGGIPALLIGAVILGLIGIAWEWKLMPQGKYMGQGRGRLANLGLAGRLLMASAWIGVGLAVWLTPVGPAAAAAFMVKSFLLILAGIETYAYLVLRHSIIGQSTYLHLTPLTGKSVKARTPRSIILIWAQVILFLLVGAAMAWVTQSWWLGKSV